VPSRRGRVDYCSPRTPQTFCRYADRRRLHVTTTAHLDQVTRAHRALYQIAGHQWHQRVRGNARGVFHSADNGVTGPGTAGMKDSDAHSLATSGTNVFAGTSAVYRSSDNGVKWTERAKASPRPTSLPWPLAAATSTPAERGIYISQTTAPVGHVSTGSSTCTSVHPGLQLGAPRRHRRWHLPLTDTAELDARPDRKGSLGSLDTRAMSPQGRPSSPAAGLGVASFHRDGASWTALNAGLPPLRLHQH